MLNASTIRCLITAGPTREYIDPARYISSPSTGKMGFALAKAAVEQGWTVDLVAGPVALSEPEGSILYPVTSAEEMYHQVDALFDACDILIMAAAVSDFRPDKIYPKKVKKQNALMSIICEPTIDILKTVSIRKEHQLVVGFAAESEDVEMHAYSKLIDKKCDWIVANDISKSGAGFAADTNEVVIFNSSGGRYELGPDTKKIVAEEIINILKDSFLGK